ncbi:TetR/AcrR family transcriptional regulator [Sneathiella litorea]|uniref:TetR family transcriptional regulator n=1 Tax=Sneathiella litorea TaxID=2606216 RepID=A0A6L8W6T0_9PROT|nr:TetR/AcrR family transcriptional regulator [Sneathiella litorea]MZR30409.1 TetR family transcriptional regulator [Sneathiella litorea]
MNKPVHRSQMERTQEMRDRLCRATLEVITDVGYEKTTTTMIAERAGVSRGAQTHHFPTKFDLVNASFKYLLRDWEDKRAAETGGVETELSIESYIRFLWKEIFGHPLYVAALELMLAARGDKRLHKGLVAALDELTVLRQTMWHHIFAGTGAEKERDIIMQMTVCLLRGLSMQGSIEDTNAHEEEVINMWIEMLKMRISRAEANK